MAASTAFSHTTRLQAPVQHFPGETRQWVLGVRTRTERISNLWIVSVFGLLVCTFLVYFHTVLLENQANKKQQQIIQMKEQNDMFQAQLAELRTLSSVEARAMAMGMQPVEQYQYISLSPEIYQEAIQTDLIEAESARYPVQPPVGF